MSMWTVLFAALIILGVIAATRFLREIADRLPPERLTPEDLLGERFARGEIDEQEYRRGLDTLRAVRRPTIKA